MFAAAKANGRGASAPNHGVSDGRGASAPTHGVSGIYRIHVPHTIKTSDDVGRIPAPTLEVATADVYAIIAGGNTSGKADPSVNTQS